MRRFVAFDPTLIEKLDHRVQPLKRLLSPISVGSENVPREGVVLWTGDHSIYDLVDIPMLGLELFEKTGPTVPRAGARSPDQTHFTWRY